MAEVMRQLIGDVPRRKFARVVSVKSSRVTEVDEAMLLENWAVLDSRDCAA
jgi:hypothetical protein